MAKRPRTPEEITRQIEGLKKEKEALPQFSKFSTDNWQLNDTIISILEGKTNLNDLPQGDWETMDQENENYIAAQDADMWLSGDRVHDLFSL